MTDLETCPGLSTKKAGVCRKCGGIAAVFWSRTSSLFVLACTRCRSLDVKALRAKAVVDGADVYVDEQVER